MLDPFGGQTVTTGKPRLLMGFVLMVVAMGDSCHLAYELLMIKPARANPVQTMQNQANLTIFDWVKRNYPN